MIQPTDSLADRPELTNSHQSPPLQAPPTATVTSTGYLRENGSTHDPLPNEELQSLVDIKS